MYNITLIPGDGIGPEITDITVKVVNATGIKINWEKMSAGEIAIEKYNTPLPQETIDSIRRNKVALKGPITTPIGTGYRSVNVSLRKILDLYACLRPCKTYSNIKSTHYKDIDIVIIRENTEDLYAGIEFQSGDISTEKIIEFCNKIIKEKGDQTQQINNQSAISLKIISKNASERIVKFAFEYAKKNHRKKVTAVTKANIMKYTDGLFFEVSRQISQLYPEIEYEEKLIDNMCMQLVQKPQIYDVLVLPNLYGDIVSDLCAGIVGGLGVAGGANIGKDISVFEPVHGSAPKYKGQNKVNPISMILSSKLMLEHIGEKEKANLIEKSVIKTISEGKVLTYDLYGNSNSWEVGDEIIRNLK